jgi:signal transduction histidine kinase
MNLKPRTLFGRVAMWHSLVTVIALVGFGFAAYLATTAEDEMENGQEITVSAEDKDLAQEQILINLLIALPLTLVLSLVGGLLLSRSALASLEAMAQKTAALDAKNLSARVPIPKEASIEVGQLGASINQMLERIEKSVQSTQRFVASASHELRTPLALVMGELELSLRHPKERADLETTVVGSLEELGRLSRIVEALLTLARADANQLPIEKKPTDINLLVERVIESFVPVANERNVSLRVVSNENMRVSTDELWLTRALANLVDNACKYVSSPGTIDVQVTQNENRVQISVIDSGNEILANEKLLLFERFFRGKNSHQGGQGFGLGLPLAREILSALGGTLSFDESHQQGTRFFIELPK